MTDPRIIQILEHVSYALDQLERIAEDIVDPHDYRLVQLRQSNGLIDQLLVALQTPDPVSPHSKPDKEPTAPAGEANQAAPEFASHSVGDLVELPDGRRGVIGEIGEFGIATVNLQYGDSIRRDLCALKNLSRKEKV